jgi:phage shock protein A
MDRKQRQRLWQALRALGWGGGRGGSSGIDALHDDPEQLLNRAQQEMRELHARNRERAVRAIMQKNNLEQMVTETEKKVAMFREQADVAERSGDVVGAAAHRHSAETHQRVLEDIRVSLNQAAEVAEKVKQAIRREEERVLERTSQALALKAQWKVLQVQREIAGVARALRQGAADADVVARQGKALLDEAQHQRESLARMAESTRYRVESLREKATAARRRGDEEAERTLLRSMEQNEATLAQMNEALAQAVEVTTRAERFLSGDAGPESLAPWDTPPASASGQASTEGTGAGTLSDAAIFGLAVFAAVMILLALWLLVQ